MAKDFDQWDESRNAVYSGEQPYDDRHTPVKQDAFDLADWSRFPTRASVIAECQRLQRAYDSVSRAYETAREQARKAEADLTSQLSANTLSVVTRIEELSQKLNVMNTKLNQLVGHDESEAQIRLAQVKEALGEEWVDIECDGDVVSGARVMASQLEHYSNWVKQIKQAADKEPK